MPALNAVWSWAALRPRPHHRAVLYAASTLLSTLCSLEWNQLQGGLSCWIH